MTIVLVKNLLALETAHQEKYSEIIYILRLL